MRSFFLLFIFCLIVSANLYAQKSFTGIILDKDTNLPLEFVDVYNEFDYTSSNADGKFAFYTEGTNVNFNLLGYKNLSKYIEDINSDTIYLKSKFYELDEVVVSNNNEPILNVFKKIESNYPFNPYTESFFLRSSLKKGDELVKLQDISGIVQRKALLSTSKSPLPKKNYLVNVENMRKAGIDEREVYFEMFSLEELFTAMTSIYVNPKSYHFDQTSSEDSLFTKFSFSPKPTSKFSSKGYYIVNTEDLAFNEFYLINDSKEQAFHEKGEFKYRTIFYEVNVRFKKNQNDAKYYIDKASINATVEVTDSSAKLELYNAKYHWYTHGLVDLEVKKNVPNKKDLFRINKPYINEFWQNQNQLLLTAEMETFLNKLTSSSRNEYNIISNIESPN